MRRIQAKYAGLLFRQIGSTLSAGLSLVETLNLIGSSIRHPGSRRLISDLKASVESGGLISEALKPWRQSIPEVVPALIGLGEETGNLDSTLLAVSELFDFFHKIRQRVISGLLYPVFILVFGILALPVPVLVTKGIQAYIATVVPAFIMGAVLIIFGSILARLARTDTPFATFISGFLLAIPVTGKITRNLTVARFARVLSMAVSSGTGMIRSLELAAAACGNRVIAANIRKMIPEIQAGRLTLAESLTKSGYFSAIFCQMVAVGERSGDLDHMLDKAEQMFREEALTSVDRALKLLGPIVFIVIAFYLGYQIIQAWGGIYSQYDSLSGM